MGEKSLTATGIVKVCRELLACASQQRDTALQMLFLVKTQPVRMAPLAASNPCSSGTVVVQGQTAGTIPPALF